MDKEIIAAYISGGAVIVAAIAGKVFGWFGGTKKENSPGSITNTANGDGNVVGSSAGGDINVTVNHGTEALSSIDKRLDEIKEILLQQKTEEAKKNLLFSKIVRNIYRKSFDELTDSERITLWDDVLMALERAEEVSKNIAIVKKEAIGAENKTLFAEIYKAFDAFDYEEVDRLLESFREKLKDVRQNLALADFLQGQSYELSNNYVGAERYYRKAATAEDENPLYLNEFAGILKILGRYTEAEPLVRGALAIKEKVMGLEHPEVTTYLNNLALLLLDQGKYAEAEPLLLRCLAIDEKALGMEHPDVATSLNNLALLLHNQGKYAEAEPLYRRSLAIREKRLSGEHPDIAQSLNNLAALLDVTQSLNNLAALLDDKGKSTEAEPLYRHALAILEKALRKGHPEIATYQNNLAVLLHKQGKSAEAEMLYRQVLATKEKTLGREHPEVASSLYNLALLLHKQGEYAEAEPLYRRALVIDEKALGMEHPNTVLCRKNLNGLLKKKKQGFCWWVARSKQ